MSHNPWGSRDWREMREAKIGNKCEQCGRHEGPMVLQHFWHPPKMNRILKEAAFELGLPQDSPEVKKLAQEKQHAMHAYYMSGESTTTWCQKCAYMYDVHNKHLCPTCGEHYCDISYRQCYHCWEEEQNGPSLF